MKFINDAYAGNVQLWKVVVFCYLIPLVPTTILLGISGDLSRNGNQFALAWAITLVVMLFYVINAILFWRNSKNTKYVFAKIVARIFSVLLGIVAGGLALGLLGR